MHKPTVQSVLVSNVALGLVLHRNGNSGRGQQQHCQINTAKLVTCVKCSLHFEFDLNLPVPKMLQA
jgi:hypothetical protein